MPGDLLGGAVSRRTTLIGGGAAALSALIDARPTRAQSERIVVYSTTLPPIQKRMADTFTKNTGISVQSLRLTTSPLAQRFLAEQKSGHHVCDIITLGSDPFFRSISEAGLLADIDAVPGVANIPASWRPGKRFVTILMAPQSIAYNTKMVSGASIPRTWLDILNPEFNGQLIMPDPRANETIIAFLDLLHSSFGDDYIRRLGQQKPKLVPTVPQGMEQIIAGEAKVIIPALAMNLIQYEGLGGPIAITPTPSPTNGAYFFSGIPTNARNKVGARLWYEFVLSPEGQEILCKDNGVSPLGKVPHSLDPPESLIERDLADSIKKAPQLYDLLGLAA